MMASMDVLTMVLAPLVVVRLTRFINSDVLFDGPRSKVVTWLTDRYGDDSKLAYLILCPWCASVYVGAVVGAAWWAWGDTRWMAAVMIALVGSYLAGFLATREGE